MRAVVVEATMLSTVIDDVGTVMIVLREEAAVAHDRRRRGSSGGRVACEYTRRRGQERRMEQHRFIVGFQ